MMTKEKASTEKISLSNRCIVPCGATGHWQVRNLIATVRDRLSPFEGLWKCLDSFEQRKWLKFVIKENITQQREPCQSSGRESAAIFFFFFKQNIHMVRKKKNTAGVYQQQQQGLFEL